MRGTRAIAVALVVAALVGMTGRGVGAVAQPAYETMRVAEEGRGMPYLVWADWAPLILALPDGGAWAFFSAQTKTPEPEDPANVVLGTRKLYAARFDPVAAVWQPAMAMEGGEIQFGPSAVVDAEGTVHLVLTDRANGDPATFGTLVYVRSTPDGGWTEPQQVAPNDEAGHQTSPQLVIDAEGGLHVVWQDQRLVDEERRAESASNADVFAADLLTDGGWTEPVQVNARPDATTNASRPELAVDGDRLVALWSVYDEATGPNTAARIEWSTRPVGDPDGWAEPQALVDRGEAQFGGRLLDMAADPTGGVVLVYGQRTSENVVFVQRLARGASEWDEAVEILRGTRGSFPDLAIAADGTAYVAYNVGSELAVHVAVTALPPGDPEPTVETVVTEGEEGIQAIPAVAIDQAGKLWVCYLHQSSGGEASEVRVLRGAILSTEPASAQPAATPRP